MAGISSKGMYGLAAMYELMRSENGTPVQIREIAERANIPQNYLEQLLVQLRRAGLVTSVRGAQGGYLLAKKPVDITVFDIFEVMEGDLCFGTYKIENPVLELFLDESQKEIRKIFSISLAELDKYQQMISQRLIYNI